MTQAEMKHKITFLLALAGTTMSMAEVPKLEVVEDDQYQRMTQGNHTDLEALMEDPSALALRLRTSPKLRRELGLSMTDIGYVLKDLAESTLQQGKDQRPSSSALPNTDTEASKWRSLVKPGMTVSEIHALIREHGTPEEVAELDSDAQPTQTCTDAASIRGSNGQPSDPVECDQSTGLWYFWDETWSERCGPYSSEQEARDRFKSYCEDELGIPGEF